MHFVQGHPFVALTAGQKLRNLRLERGLSMRQVHGASLRLSVDLRNEQLVVQPSRLSAIEHLDISPSIHRLYALATIYGTDIRELLEWYVGRT